MPEQLDADTRRFYQRAISEARNAEIPFLIGGAYAFARYTGIERHTKDLDFFVRRSDVTRVLARFAECGYHAELTHPHWLGKVSSGDAFIDVIFSSGNGLVDVDDEWFSKSVPNAVLGIPVNLCSVEEMLWSKGFVMERERFDGADVAHLIRARAEEIDWPRLIDRYGSHWRVLLGHLILFGYIYPAEHRRIPGWVIAELLSRVYSDVSENPAKERLCQGTHLSRSQYLIDIDCWGYADARLEPRGPMSREEIDRWTAAIQVDGTQ